MKSVKPDVVLLVSNVSDAILLQNTMASYDVRPLALIGVGGGHSDAAFIKILVQIQSICFICHSGQRMQTNPA